MNDQPKLTPRLLCAAAMIREGAFVADIGTDHAYLPIYLCKNGIASGAVASDINKGPVERAKENIEKYGVADKIEVTRADGLCGIEKYSPSDVMILGMGGELIARIISDAPWTKNESIRLCLQPMTHAEILRRFLTENGYSIINEALAREEKIYQIILASYTGKRETLTAPELYLGKINLTQKADGLAELAQGYVSVLQKRALGKAAAGEDNGEELKLITEIKTAIGESL